MRIMAKASWKKRMPQTAILAMPILKGSEDLFYGMDMLLAALVI